MRLDNLNNIVSSEFRKLEKSDQRSKDAPADRLSVLKKDSATISKKAETLPPEAKSLGARVAVEPDVRTTRIEDVEERIKSGYYDSSDFTEKLAEQLIKDFGL